MLLVYILVFTNRKTTIYSSINYTKRHESNVFQESLNTDNTYSLKRDANEIVYLQALKMFLLEMQADTLVILLEVVMLRSSISERIMLYNKT